MGRDRLQNHRVPVEVICLHVADEKSTEAQQETSKELKDVEAVQDQQIEEPAEAPAEEVKAEEKKVEAPAEEAEKKTDEKS